MAHSDEIKQRVEDIRTRDDVSADTEALLLIVETLNEINWTQTYVKKNIERICKNMKCDCKDYDTGPSNFY